jgi:hypothetical protein
MTKAKVDNVEQSKRDGTVTTEEGVVVDAKTGVATEDTAEGEKARELSFDEVADLVGELEPGDEGWVPLDEKGNITGPAKKGKAPKGQLAASVVAPIDTRPHALQTPSGAHLMKRMNPDPDLLERPEHTDMG